MSLADEITMPSTEWQLGDFSMWCGPTECIGGCEQSLFCAYRDIKPVSFRLFTRELNRREQVCNSYTYGNTSPGYFTVTALQVSFLKHCFFSWTPCLMFTGTSNWSTSGWLSVPPSGPGIRSHWLVTTLVYASTDVRTSGKLCGIRLTVRRALRSDSATHARHVITDESRAEPTCLFSKSVLLFMFQQMPSL